MAKCTGEHRVYRMSRRIHKLSKNQTLKIGTNRKTQIIDKRLSATMKKLRPKRHKNEQLANDSSEILGTKEIGRDKKLNDVSEVLSMKNIHNHTKLINNISVLRGTKKTEKGETLINAVSEVSGTKTTLKDDASDLTKVPDKKKIHIDKKPINVFASKKLCEDKKFSNYISAVPSTKKACKDKALVNDILEVSSAKKKTKDKKFIKNPFKVLRCHENNKKLFNDSSKVPDSKIKYTASHANEPYNRENKVNDSFKEKTNGEVSEDTSMVLRSRDTSAKLVDDSSNVPRVTKIRKSKRLLDISSEPPKSKKKYTDVEPIDDLLGVSRATQLCNSEDNLDDTPTEKTNDHTINEDSPMILRSRDTSAKLINDSSKRPPTKKIRKKKKNFVNSSKVLNSKNKLTGARFVDDKLKMFHTKPYKTENYIDGASEKNTNDANFDEDTALSLCFKDVCAKLIDDLSKISRNKKFRKNVKRFNNLSKVQGSKKKCTQAEIIDDKLKSSYCNETCNAENNVNDVPHEKTNDDKPIENLPTVLCFENKHSNPKLINDTIKKPAYAKAPALKKLNTHRNCFDKIIWRCDICYLEFANKYNLQRHTKYYVNPQFACGDTGTEVSDIKQQHTPIKNTNMNLARGIGNFKCSICNQIFNAESRVQAHMYHYHNGGLRMLQTKSVSSVLISPTSEKTGVEVNEESLKNTEKNRTDISKQPILPKPVETAIQRLGNRVIKEKIGEKQIDTTDDANVIDISKTTISEVEVENKNDETSLGHKQNRFAIQNSTSNTELAKDVESSLVESEIHNGDKDAEMDNTADKYEIRSFDMPVSTVANENYIAEESFEISQNSEEIEKTDSTRFVEVTRLDILECEKTGEQRKLTNYQGSKIIDKKVVFNNASINATEDKNMTEEQFEISDNCKRTDNADKGGVLNDASDNITRKLFEIPLNSEVIKKTVGVINVLERKEDMEKSLEILRNREVIEKVASTGLVENETFNKLDETRDQEESPEILQDCEEIEISDKNIIFNETSINVIEEKDEVEKSYEILQNCEAIEKDADIDLVNDVRCNQSDEMNEQDKSFGISLNIEDIERTDKNEVFNETIVNVPHEKDVGGESREISRENCGKMKKSRSMPIVENVNANEFEKSDESDKSHGILQNCKTNVSTEITEVFQDSSDSESEKTDYETSSEISHSFEETEQIHEPHLITYTNFNLFRQMYGTKEISNISQNFKDSDYRSVVSDVKSIDSMEGSESDQSEVAEVIDDILQDALEKPDDPVNETRLQLSLSRNTLVHELEVLLVKIKISDEEKRSSTILKDVGKTGKNNFLTNNTKSNEAYHLTRPHQSNFAKSHNDKLPVTLKDDADKITFEKGDAVNKKHNEIPKNTEYFEFTNPNMFENSNMYEKIDLADNTVLHNSTERTYGKPIEAEKSEDDANIPNTNSNNFSSDGSSSSDSEESILSEFADAINDILKESREIDEQSSDDVLRARYSCKHCYVSVMKLTVNDLKAIKSKKSTTKTIDECPTETTECQTNSSSEVLPGAMCPEMYSTEALRRKDVDHIRCNVPQRTEQPSRRRCRTRHFADCDDKATCECDKDLIGRRTSNDQRRVKNCAVKSFPKITNTPRISKMSNRSPDKCERCPNCGETFWLQSFLQLHLLQCKKSPPVKMLHQQTIKKFSREFGQGPIHPDERECRICNALFQSSDILLQHEQLYTRAKIHRCSVCRTGFPDVNLLNDHTATTHVSGAYANYCALCNQGFTGDLYRNVHTMHIHDDKVMIDRTAGESPQDLYLQKVSDDGFIRKCDVCQLVFINRKRFIEHAIYYKRDASIRCNLCNADFDGQYSAHSHNKMLHYSAEMRNAYPHSCPICHEGFIYKRHLQAHVYHVHRKPFKPFGSLDVKRVTILGSVVKTSSGCSSSPVGLGNIYTCNVCEMSFLTADLLASHRIEYSKGGRFSCTRCDKKCRMASLLLDHILLNHSKAVNECVRCLSCNENLPNPSDGMAHVKHFHLNDVREPSEFYVEMNIASVKDFGINQSDLIPKNRPISDGSAYIKIETEIDRDWSSKAVSLIDASKLEKREKIQKSSGEQQTEKRKKVGKVSSEQQIEKLADEKKWSCSICSVNFRSSAELAKHASLWADEGSYMCEVCGRRFKLIRFYQEHRMKHFRCHAKEDHYFCASCNEGFETMQLMTMHKAHVHGKEMDRLPSETLRVKKFAANSTQNRQSVPSGEQKISTSAMRSVGISSNLEYNTMSNPLHIGCSIVADSPDLREKESHHQKKHSVDDTLYDRVTLDSDAVVTIDDFNESSNLLSTTAVKRKNVEVITITDESLNAGPTKVLASKNVMNHPANSAKINQLTGVTNTPLASSLNLHFVGDASTVRGASKGRNVSFDATVARENLKKRTIALIDSNVCPVSLNAMNVRPVTLSGTNAHGITVNGANLRLMAIDATDAHEIVLNGANVRMIALNTANTHPVPSSNTNAMKAHPVVSAATNVCPVVSIATNVRPVVATVMNACQVLSNLGTIRRKALTTRNVRATASAATNANWIAPTATVLHSVPLKTSSRHVAVSKATAKHPVAHSIAVRHLIASNTAIKQPVVSNAIVRHAATPNCIISRSVTSNTPNADTVVSKVIKVCPVTSIAPNTSGLVSNVTKTCPITSTVTTTRSVASPPARDIFVTVVGPPDGTSIVQNNSFDILGCKSCNIIFTSVDQLNSHEVSVHGLKSTDIQIIEDITPKRDNTSVTLLKKSVKELQWLVNSLPVAPNRPIDRTHVRKDHADFDFQAVNPSITPTKCCKLVNKTFNGTQTSTTVTSTLATVDDVPECTILINEDPLDQSPAESKIQHIARFLNSPRQQDVTKRKSELTKIVQPEEKRSRESSYDPKVYEELCRQHSSTAHSTIKKSEVPVITLL